MCKDTYFLPCIAETSHKLLLFLSGYVGRIYENPPDQVDETTHRVFQTELSVSFPYTTVHNKRFKTSKNKEFLRVFGS